MSNFAWKKKRYVALTALLLTIFAGSAALGAKEIQWKQSIEKGLAQAQKTGKPIMMDFYTDW